MSAVVIAATQLGGDDDDADATDPEATSSDAPPASPGPAITGGAGGSARSTAPSKGASDASAAPRAPGEADGVGHTFELSGGAKVRVDSVIPNAPEPEGVFAPPEDVSLTRVEVEGCGGDTRFAMGGESWLGYLDDLRPAELFAGASNVVDVVPAAGGCVHFNLAYAVPEGRFLEHLVFAVGGDELSRWQLTFGEAPTEPLTGDAAPTAAETGETVELDNDATVVLRSVEVNPPATDAATTPPDGSQYVAVDGQVCAGSVAVAIRPFSWTVIATDNRVGTNVFAPSTFPSTELAPGQCGWGTVHLLTEADAVPAFVVFSDAEGTEIARWSVTG